MRSESPPGFLGVSIKLAAFQGETTGALSSRWVPAALVCF